MSVEPTDTFARRQFHPLAVREVRRETRDAVSIRFEVPPALAGIFAFQAGQYLTLRTEIDGAEVRRNYSVCAAPHDSELRIAVKHLPGGRFSGYATGVLQAGDVLDVMPAMGRFTLPFEAGRRGCYVAFAVGSGITPILSILKTGLRVEPGSRFVLFYGNRHSRDILFLEALAALKNCYMQRLEIFHFLSGEADDFELFQGRLDAAKCEHILRTLIDPARVDTFLICGPEPMMREAETVLRARGVAADKILVERFASAGAAAATPIGAGVAREAAGRRIGVVMDGRRSTVRFDAALGNILDTVRAAEIPAPFACKGGVCCTCRAKILQGQATMQVNYGLTAEELAQGYILTCQATPLGDDLVISYDV